MKIVNLEPTPNPNAFKFNVDEELTQGIPRSYPNAESADDDPLAKLIFSVEGIESVFYLGHFLTVSKTNESETEEVLKAAGQHLLDFDVQLLAELADKQPEKSEEVSEKMQQINDILDEMVRPALAGDGGGLAVVGFDNNTLFIQYQGACGTCPSAITGTLMAIERLIQAQVDPEINVVSA